MSEVGTCVRGGRSERSGGGLRRVRGEPDGVLGLEEIDDRAENWLGS